MRDSLNRMWISSPFGGVMLVMPLAGDGEDANSCKSTTDRDRVRVRVGNRVGCYAGASLARRSGDGQPAFQVAGAMWVEITIAFVVGAATAAFFAHRIYRSRGR